LRRAGAVGQDAIPLTLRQRAATVRPDSKGARESPSRRAQRVSHIIIVLLVAAFIFRKPLGRLLRHQFPNRGKRQQVLATVIAAFLLVIAIRLFALFW